MAANLSELRAAQARALDALARGEGEAVAADAAGVSERSLRRWRARPDFAAALRDRRNAALRLAGAELVAGAAEAVVALRALLGDAEVPGSVKVAAARVLLDGAFRYVETVDLEERMAALEAAHAEAARWREGT